MSRGRSLLVLAAITVITVIAAGLSMQNLEVDAIPSRGEPVFPDLLSRAHEVAEIRAVTNRRAFRLELAGGRWVMAEKSGYPAAGDKVHQLVVGAAGLKRLGPKTSNPDLYPRIGLEAPEAVDAKSVRFTILDAGGETLAEFIVGNRQASKIDLDLNELYLREPGEPQSWLVEGKLPRSKIQVDWLDREILKIDHERVRDVRVTHLDGDVVEVRRASRTQSEFELLGIPADHEVRDQWRVNDIGRGLADLRLDDVRRIEDSDVDSPGYTIEFTTFDGLRVRALTYLSAETTYARLEAAFDAALAEPAEDAAENEAPAQASSTPDVVRAEAERLNARWRGWEYQLAKFKADYFVMRVAELVEPKESAETQSQ